MSDSSENSTSTSDPPTPPPKRQKASTSTGKHKGARTHKGKEGERKGKGKKRREPSPSSASSGSDSNSPDHKSTKLKRCVKKIKSSRKIEPSSQDGPSHLNIFRQHYSDLVMSISHCLNTVADLLFSRNLISRELLRQVLDKHESNQNLASKVVFGVQDYIMLNPDDLIKFIRILKKESSCEEISKRIMSK